MLISRGQDRIGSLPRCFCEASDKLFRFLERANRINYHDRAERHYNIIIHLVRDKILSLLIFLISITL